jgi:hypothetical protein
MWLVAQLARGRGDAWLALLGSAAGGGAYLAIVTALHPREARQLVRLARERLGIDRKTSEVFRDLGGP